MDVISVEDDLSGYALVTAPMLYMCKDGFDGKLRKFVEGGGFFLTTYFSGYVEDHDLVVTGGYPGRLKDILGIWVEESDALPEGEGNRFLYGGKEYRAEILCDLLHLQGAEALSVYEEDFYAGMPVLTAHSYGKGKAFYMAARSGDDFYEEFIKDLCEEAGIRPIMEAPQQIEVTMRENGNGKFLFLLNHGEDTQEAVLPCGGEDLLTGGRYGKGEKLRLGKKDVAILKVLTE